MKFFFTTIAVGFASALLPFVNIEAYLGGAGTQHPSAGVVAISFAAAFGQTVGKVVLYFAADWAMNLPWIRKKMASEKWQASYARWKTRIDEHPGQTAALLFASASLGFPPLLVVAVLAGNLKVKLWLFVLTCLTGRWIRFLVILGAADWISRWFT